MKYFNILESPIEISGLTVTHDDKFHRLPPEIIDRVSAGVSWGAKCSTGGCVRFSTDSRNVEVKVTLRGGGNMSHMPLTGESGTDIYFDGLFVTTARPSTVGVTEYNAVAGRPVVLEAGMHKVECFLPLYNGITKMEIGIDDDATLAAPPKYKIEKPVLFYGSSITQGGCASKPGNSHAAFLSRWLDFPQNNQGYSGSAKGEPLMARYFAILDLAALVLDYDHNAPNVEHLRDTHENFFRIIREAQPELPIIFVSKPDFDKDPTDGTRHRDVIRETYTNAVKNGDKKVWFVDGESMFGPYTKFNDRRACTVDGCHPNDLGFYRMAQAIRPALEEALGIK